MPVFGYSVRDLNNAYEMGRATGKLEATVDSIRELDDGEAYSEWLNCFLDHAVNLLKEREGILNENWIIISLTEALARASRETEYNGH